MATAPTTPAMLGNPDYPTGDGKPVTETDYHFNLWMSLIDILRAYYAADPNAYVSGGIMLFYEKGNRRKYVAPDVLVVKGVPKGNRLNFLVWEEGKAPQLVIELTSSSTRWKDTKKKYQLYQDILKVREYFIFDPLGHYLDPQLQGFRLRSGKYVPIKLLHRRLPSQVLGLHLEADGKELRIYSPTRGGWLPTMSERIADAQERATQARNRLAQTRNRLERARVSVVTCAPANARLPARAPRGE